ncbi:MAG: hypothetical protein R3202_07070 [Candidatus Competibacterales bacterium]|nr:hypothetical protein [Candidatus Competibacterales bacterium]
MPRILSSVLLLCAATATAGEADVLAVEAIRTGDRVYRFEVTVRHADTGWDHYADRWEVLAPDETVLATRVLYHPHVDEQPFTRSLGGVEIPKPVTEVRIRARDSVHGHGGAERVVPLD